jgi:hypothetical protein
MKLYVGLLALTNVMSARVKIGSVESKKGLLFFITALSFGFKCSVEWKLVKATGTAQRNKANDCRETAFLMVKDSLPYKCK